MQLQELQRQLKTLSDPTTAVFLQRFFKTGPGEYAEGDLFRGIRVPALRKLARQYDVLTLAETKKLLRSPHHEDRLLALLILTRAYGRGDDGVRENIFDLYLKNTRFINNWDLVDASAGPIVGAFLWDKKRDVLYRLAKSRNLWERRIAIISTFHFIKRGELRDTLSIAEILLSDKEDLIHKAVGWMLREVGKRNMKAEEAFLLANHREMPRVMLRYAIEKFPERKRQRFLKRTAC
jgi:3-methyladenine DNA glycosylase AlkD